jgi:hypothetical protein
VARRTIRSGVSRLAFSLAKGSFFIIVFALATGWAVSEGLSLVVGLWVGFALAWGASRFFGWDRAAPKHVYLWGIVGGVLVLVVLFVVGVMDFGLIPATPAVTVTFYTACGLVLGAVLLAGGIGRPLPEEER